MLFLAHLTKQRPKNRNILPLFYIGFRPDNSVKKQMPIISFMNYKIGAIPLLSLKRMDFIKYRLGHFINWKMQLKWNAGCAWTGIQPGLQHDNFI